MDIIGKYRLIYLKSTFSKILKILVLGRILKRLTLNNLISERQHGLLPLKSTQTVLVHLLKRIIDKLEDGEYIIGISWN